MCLQSIGDTMSRTEYAFDVQVDSDNLPWEWGRQSSIYMKYGIKEANAAYTKDKTKERLDLLISKKKLEVVRNKEKYNLPDNAKIGEIDAVVSLFPEIIELQEEYLLDCKECRVLKHALRALDHKKTALEYATELIFKYHYSEPKIEMEVKNKVTGNGSEEERTALRDNSRMQSRKKRRLQKLKTQNKGQENG